MKLKFYVIILFIVIFSCKKEKATEIYKPVFENINLSEWNDSTIDYAFEFCDLEKNKYEDMPLIINKARKVLTLKTHLTEILEKRKFLIDTIKKSNF